MNASSKRTAYSLVEVIAALAIFTIGVIGILQYFPPSLRAAADASIKSKAALLAQAKVEEIRRDSDKTGTMVTEIKNLAQPTNPMVFPQDNRLMYQFHSRSLLSPDNDDPGLSYDDFGVARVIVRYNTDFRRSGDVLVELRFDR